MADRSPISRQLRAYLSGLEPRTRVRLLLELERGANDANRDPVQHFLLGEVRAVVQEQGDEAPRVPDPMRLYLDPIDHFLVDKMPPAKTPGRIHREAVVRIWTWAARDILPERIRALNIDLTRHVGPDGDTGSFDETARAIVDDYRSDVTVALSNAVVYARNEPGAFRKLAAMIGGQRGVDELEDILELASTAKARANIIAEVPASVDIADPGGLAILKKALDAADRAGGRTAHYLAIELRPRIVDVAHVPQAVASDVGSDDARVIAAQPIGRLIDIVIRDISDGATRLAEALVGAGDCAKELLDLAHLKRQLRAAIELDEATSDWSNAVTAIRRDVGQRVSDALAEVPQLLRRSMRSLRAFGTRPLSRPDEFDVARVCRLLRLFDVAKLIGSEMALGEVVQRSRTDIEGYIAQTTSILVDELRSTTRDKRDILLAHAASAVRINEALFGAQEASIVRRSLEVAAGTKLSIVQAAA